MVGVILAAGRGERLGDITRFMPKPMVPVVGRPAISYVIEGMQDSGVEDITVVVKHKGEIIRDYISREYPGIRCITQGKAYGTAAALRPARPYVPLRDSVMVAFGDIIAIPDMIYTDVRAQFMARDCNAVLAVNKTDTPALCGVIETKPTGEVKRIQEKQEYPVSNLNNTGIYCFKRNIFKFLSWVAEDERGEFNLVSAINMLCIHGGVYTVEFKGELFDIGSPEKLAEVNERVGVMDDRT